jgi:hypothetical protein
MLNAFNGLAGITFVPMPIESLRCHPELDKEVAGEVLRLEVPPLFPPESKQGGFVIPHNDAGVGAAVASST